MVPCDDGKHLINLDRNLSHFGWVFRKVPGGWPYSVRLATDNEMIYAQLRLLQTQGEAERQKQAAGGAQ
jgi:hypothetical protein